MHAIAALAFTLFAVLWARGAEGMQGGVALIVLGVWVVATTLFRKRILRVFLGAKTPMILAGEQGWFSHGAKPKVVLIAGLVAGVVFGFTASLYTTYEDAEFAVMMAGVLGAAIAMTGLEWKRTGLWEFIPVTFLLIVALATILHEHDLGDTLLSLFLVYGLLSASLLGASFFLRWRRWVKSLPESVTTGEV